MDTGTVTYSILGKEDFLDSVLWNFKERRNIHRLYFFAGVLQSDSAIFDSTLFNLVELKSGRHELYRRSDASVGWNSVLPFLSDMPDSAKLFRYYRLDSAETIFFTLKYRQEAIEYGITLKKSIGLQALLVTSTDTWQDGPPHAHHELLTQTITVVNENRLVMLPSTIRLEQNYPNPFNPSTSISFAIPKHTLVQLQVFNVLGQLMQTLVDEDKQPGLYNVTWDASHKSSGLYFYRIAAGEFVQTKKAVLIR